MEGRLGQDCDCALKRHAVDNDNGKLRAVFWYSELRLLCGGFILHLRCLMRTGMLGQYQHCGYCVVYEAPM